MKIITIYIIYLVSYNLYYIVCYIYKLIYLYIPINTFPCIIVFNDTNN